MSCASIFSSELRKRPARLIEWKFPSAAAVHLAPNGTIEVDDSMNLSFQPAESAKSFSSPLHSSSSTLVWELSQLSPVNGNCFRRPLVVVAVVVVVVVAAAATTTLRLDPAAAQTGGEIITSLSALLQAARPARR